MVKDATCPQVSQNRGLINCWTPSGIRGEVKGLFGMLSCMAGGVASFETSEDASDGLKDTTGFAGPHVTLRMA